RAVDAAGLMNQHRRDLLAGLMWHACRRLADAASFGEARRFWRKVHRDFGLINEQQFAEGWLYHRSGKIAWFNRLKEDRVATGWPRHFRRAVEGSRTHCRVRPTGTPPAISVLLPAYNANRYIEQAVESILLQTFRDFELLIVDDGSTDGTAEKLERLADRDVRVQLVRRPRGRGKGYVQGLIEMAGRARGEFLARMDADDVARPERFELQIDRLRSDADLVLVGGQVRWVDPYGLDLESSHYPTTHDAIDAELLAGRGGVIPHPGSLFRKSAYEQVGGYRNGFQPSEDLDLWLRLAEVGRVANVDEVILDYRQHFASVTRSRRDEQLRVKPRIIAEACQRRGLPAPDEASLDQWEPAPPDQLLYRWGWQAIKERHLEAARGHAWSLVRRRPFDRDAWHLAACAVRGR
ncbi:MAG: glycosyltransferase, partial [Planctomycetota bacterium]